MAIIFHSSKYRDIQIDSNMIIGITGIDYDKFLKTLEGNRVNYIGKEIEYDGKTVKNFIKDESQIDSYLKDLGLTNEFLNKRIDNLSHSEKKILKYLNMLISQANIIVVDEPFLDLDYDNKKRIINLFNRLSKSKTIIIGSTSTDIIYSLCKKVLLLGKDKYLYEDVNILANKSILRQYHLVMPEMLEFIRLANDKKAHLSYSKDIRDLIKDVYKHVSK